MLTDCVATEPCRTASPTSVLLADAQAADQFRVALRVLALQVIEQAPALTDQLQQAAARVMILRVGLEVFGEVVDALAEERHLNFGGAGVGRESCTFR